MATDGTGASRSRKPPVPHGRRWRYDFGLVETQKVAVEIEGITHYGNGIGRHQSAKGFVADCEKYEAALLATVWRLFGWTFQDP